MKVTEQGRRRRRKSGICGIRQAQKNRTEEGIHPHGHNNKGNIQIVVRRQSCLVAKRYTSARLNQCLPSSPCFVLSIPSTVSFSLSLKKVLLSRSWGTPKSDQERESFIPSISHDAKKNQDKGKWGHFHFSVLLSEPKNTEMRRKLEK